MRGVGAYYATTYNQAIGPDTLGASPDGLGAVQMPEPGFAEDALSHLLAGSLKIPGAPAAASPVLGVYTPWATQTGDVDWQPVKPEWNLLVTPITDAQLALAKQATFGQPVGWVAVMTVVPAKLALAENAFDSSEYEFVGSEATYRQDDQSATPKPYYFYWAKLRDDTTGGKGSLAAVAKALGGQLVFPMQAPLTGKERVAPAGPFAQAGATVVTLGPGVTPSVPAATAAATSSGKPSWLLLLAVGGAAAAGGWWLVKRSRRKPG